MRKEVNMKSYGKYFTAISSRNERIVNLLIEKYQVNLSFAEIRCFISIADNPGISQKELAILTVLDKTTITKNVKKLMYNGYIERKSNEYDKRVYNLYLSDEGKKLKPTVKAILSKFTELISSVISDEEEKLFFEIMERIIIKLDESIPQIAKK